MKFRNLFAICASLIVFAPTLVRAQVSVQNGNTIVETDGNGRMIIFTDKTRIDTSRKYRWFDPSQLWWRSYYNRHPRSTCYQTNRQTTRVDGSGRRITQTSVSKCD